MTEFSSQNKDALSRAIEYWIENWDFECPTLFGMELADLEKILNIWPDTLLSMNEQTLIACLGSLRELLYGASAFPKVIIIAAIGISYDQADELCDTLYQECHNAL